MPDPYGMVAGADAASTAASGQSAMQVIPQLAGILNIFVGLMLTTGILFFVGGFIEYIAHLGIKEREKGLEKMHLGVAILFVLAALLWLSQFVQGHTAFVITLLGAALVLFLGWVFLGDLLAPAPEAKPEKK
ncbi:hypothetical protein FJY94_03285 [Candidatus Kaiserbacteria bacterium]|nr:hypothetical protein [Candidatus Kaiserbacteria bacterium]